MELKIVSPQETKTHTILWLEALTPLGSFVIQPGHAPTVHILLPNKEVTFGLKNGKRETVLVPHGILEIDREKVILLINQPL